MILREEKKLTNKPAKIGTFVPHTNTHTQPKVSEILHPEFRCIYATNDVCHYQKSIRKKEISSCNTSKSTNSNENRTQATDNTTVEGDNGIFRLNHCFAFDILEIANDKRKWHNCRREGNPFFVWKKVLIHSHYHIRSIRN